MSAESQPSDNCLSCGRAGLAAVLSLEREGARHESADHRFVYRHLIITRCGACGTGQIERWDHDCWAYHGDEVWDQREWYLLTASGMETLADLLPTCPAPLSPNCRCALHTGLRGACQTLPRSWWGVGSEGA